jgi:hypothetical protein
MEGGIGGDEKNVTGREKLEKEKKFKSERAKEK